MLTDRRSKGSREFFWNQYKLVINGIMVAANAKRAVRDGMDGTVLRYFAAHC